MFFVSLQGDKLMKLKFAVPLVALSVASSAAMAAAQAGPSQSQGASAQPMTSLTCGNTNMSSCIGGTYSPTQLTMMDALKGSANWTDVIKVGLLMNADAFFQTNYQSNTLAGQAAAFANAKSDASGFAYNARLNIDSQVNSWVSAHLGLFMANGSANTAHSDPFANAGKQPYGINGGTGTRYYVASNQRSGIDIDEAYITVDNPSKAPVAMRLGRQYMPFGQYDLNAVMPTLYEQAVKMRQEALTVGYYGSQGMLGGVSAQVYAFNGVQKQSALTGSGSSNINSWGATLGYASGVNLFPQAHARTNLQVGYLDNYLNTGLLTSAIGRSTGATAGAYSRSVGAVALDGTLGFGQVGQTPINRFIIDAHYVVPTGSVRAANGLYNYSNNTLSTTGSIKPQAGSVMGGVRFMSMNRPSQFKLSYQWTKDYAIYTGTTLLPVNLIQMPKDRVAGQYTVTLMPKTQLGLELNWDNPYSVGNGGSAAAKDSITGIARMSVLLG